MHEHHHRPSAIRSAYQPGPVKQLSCVKLSMISTVRKQSQTVHILRSIKCMHTWLLVTSYSTTYLGMRTAHNGPSLSTYRTA